MNGKLTGLKNNVCRATRILGRGGNALLELLLPRRCAVCGGMLTDADGQICPMCLAMMPETRFHRTYGNEMERRFMAEPEFERATALFSYTRDSAVAMAIHDFKYNHRPGLALELGREMGRRLLATGFPGDADIILPVPVHILKRMHRGYNQSERLAQGYSQITGIPVGTNLYARRPHGSQTGRTLSSRRANTAGVFAVSNPSQLLGRHILLIDDVCTTGSTLTACAEAIRSELAQFPPIEHPVAGTTALRRGQFRFSVLTLAAARYH